MLRTLRLLSVVSLYFVSTLAHAQEQEVINIGRSTTAVTKLTGHINFGDVGMHTQFSAPGKSFFTARIGGEIYTNNDVAPMGSKALGTPTVVASDETIVTTWEVGSLRIEQFVEPYLGGSAPLTRYQATNLASSPIEIEPQYLLDVRIGKFDGERYSLESASSNSWSVFTSPIPSKANFAEGWLDDTMYWGAMVDMDLQTGHKAPSVVMFGNWDQMERIAFIDLAMSLPTTKLTDLAVAMQWDAVTLGPGEVQTIGAFGYPMSVHYLASVDPATRSSMIVWPNPASRILNVTSAYPIQGSIQNMLGQTVWSGLLEGASSIDVGQLAPGSYFLAAEGKATPFVVGR